MSKKSSRIRAEEKIQQQNEELAAVNAISSMVNQSLNLEEVLRTALERTLSVLKVESGLIYLFDEAAQTFTPVTHQGISEALLQELSGFRLGQGLSGHVAKSGNPLVTDLDSNPKNISPTSLREGLRSYAGVPITVKDKLLGVMVLVTRQEEYFKEKHLGLLGHIGNIVGTAIENASLYEKAQQEIAQRKRTEEALRESEKRLQILLDSLGEGVILQDASERIVLWNQTAAEIFNINTDRVLGCTATQHLWNTIREDGSEFPAREHPSLHTLATGEPCTGITMGIVRGEKDTKWIKINTKPLFRGEGTKPYAAIISFSDITEFKHAEKALNDERSFLSVVLDNIEEAIVTCDREGRLLRFNEAARRLHGVPEQPIPPNQWAEHYDLYRVDGITPLPTEEIPLFRALKGDRVQNAEIVVAPKHGENRSMACSGQALTSDAGEIIGAVVAMHDITERKKAEEALRDSERRFQKMLSVVPDMISIQNPQMDILYSNWAGFGAVPESRRILNTKCYRTYRGFDDICPDCRAKSVLESGEAVQEEVRLPDGKWFDVRVIPVLEKGNHVEMFMEWVRDITERKQAEVSLRKSEERLSTILDQSPIPTAVGGFDGSIKSFNKALEEMIGYKENEIRDVHDWALKLYPKKEYRKFVQKNINQALEGKKQDCTEFTTTSKDGSEKIVSFNTSFFDEGLIIQMVYITESRRAEEQRKRLEAQLRQSQKMEAVGTLAGGVAHDFNNILGVILGNTELAMFDLPPRSHAQGNLKEVHKACLRARDLVTQILLFARQKDHTLSHIRVGPIAKESLKLLRASIPTTVEIRQEIQEGLPTVLADPTQVQQIIMNLCANAGQVMESKGGTLSFKLDSVTLDAPMDTRTGHIPKGRYVRIQVGDTGSGIPPENLERIFDPFFTTKEVGEGTGLGLAVVHGIVQDRHGGITVQSEKGKGTWFMIYLPVSEEATVEEERDEESAFPKGRERILFVDDEPMILEMGKQMLERQGYQVETRATGTDALEYFEQNPDRFDFVLTDMNMPGLRGDKLAEELLKIRPDIPVVLSTGFSKQISEEKAKKIGIRAFVMKPITAQKLASTVRRILDEEQ